MKHPAKYFSAADYDSAVSTAKEYFKKEDIFIETAREGNEMTPWFVLAVAGSVSDIENMDGFFQLYYEEDGTYLEIYPNRGAGISINREKVTGYLSRKSISMIDSAEVLTLIEKKYGRAKIAPPQNEKLVGEDVEVEIASGDMEASIRLLPPDEGGTVLSANDIKTKITAAGVCFGVDEAAIEDAISEKKYGKTYVVAKGLPAENGEDGRLEFHFSTEQKDNRPIEDEKGKIDFRNLDLFEAVTVNQILVTRVPATAGSPGSTVKGKALNPKPGKNVNMPKSKNTVLNEDNTAMYSKLNGMVDYTNKSVIVSDVYRVAGDCDLSVGNIDFDGSIVITGNVISGIVIKAAGSISVGGIVEGAELIAEDNIDLKRGIQGMDRGRIVAGGSVTALFIERATVISGEDLTADVILHSIIEVGRSLILRGKRGNIMGGKARIGREIRAQVLGSVAHPQTDIEVGILPQKRARIQFLKAEIERLTQELEKLQKINQYLQKSQNVSNEDREKIRESAAANLSLNAKLFRDYSEELNILENEAEQAVDGKVHVTGTTHPGVRISIGKDMYRVEESVDYATFKYRDGAVHFSACEISKI